jgi:hypothetical protein
MWIKIWRIGSRWPDSCCIISLRFSSTFSWFLASCCWCFALNPRLPYFVSSFFTMIITPRKLASVLLLSLLSDERFWKWHFSFLDVSSKERLFDANEIIVISNRLGDWGWDWLWTNEYKRVNEHPNSILSQVFSILTLAWQLNPKWTTVTSYSASSWSQWVMTRRRERFDHRLPCLWRRNSRFESKKFVCELWELAKISASPVLMPSLRFFCIQIQKR